MNKDSLFIATQHVKKDQNMVNTHHDENDDSSISRLEIFNMIMTRNFNFGRESTETRTFFDLARLTHTSLYGAEPVMI